MDQCIASDLRQKREQGSQTGTGRNNGQWSKGIFHKTVIDI